MTVLVTLSEHEARSLANAAELLRDALDAAHVKCTQSALGLAHAKLISAIERGELTAAMDRIGPVEPPNPLEQKRWHPLTGPV